ncbi:cytochrome C [candidate division KSB1 bacterium]|nr:cytochrome C [candidate division KSB1 bacterium]
MVKQICLFVLVFTFLLIFFNSILFSDDEPCVQCHIKISPGQVADWRTSQHFEEGITCSTCHGEEHNSKENVNLVQFPDEHVCGECHDTQFEQFKKGKHNFGWTSLNALPVTHVEPDELMEGGRGCGGCHNMGIKTEAQKKELREKGYRYQNNSCDECHTRHSFSKKEAQDPRACQQCHMGYDHPQWEMWSSAKHGTRWFAKENGRLPKEAAAPSCQNCHLPNGTHENRTAWGFLGVRLPLPENPQWAADRITILKALGVLNPETGKPTPRLEIVKAVDMARLTDEAWQKERDKMIETCNKCHSKLYAQEQLEMGDAIMKKADRLLAQAIDIVADLYKDDILKKPDNYSFAYPDFLYFMRTGSGNLKQASYIEQVLFQMYMKHRMRTYQGFFHVNPDYAYWYGWAMMTKDLGEIRELAETMRVTYKLKK